jgi:molybdenum cofactor biosynthesis protein MoaC
MKKEITAFFENSKYHMADITKKAPTFRRAVSMGKIHVGEVGFSHIKNETLPKGDVLKLAEIAGVQGAKNAWQQIPMCHPLQLEHVALYLDPEEKSHSIIAYAVVSTTAKTGVEMEALAAVNAALLTLYDLTKPVEPALSISSIRLLLKEGGKKGLWVHPEGIPPALQAFLPTKSKRPLENRTAAVITLSDRAHKGEYEDKSGPVLQKKLEELGCKITDYLVLPDEAAQLEKKISDLSGKVDLIVTTGGTGISPRDITPETLSKHARIEIPGIGELLRSFGAKHVPTAWLSRSLAAVIDTTLVISLPGNPNAVKDSIEALKEILPHALDHVKNKKNLHKQEEAA